MPDLNDLYFFTEVVTHGGFAAAGRAHEYGRHVTWRVPLREQGDKIRDARGDCKRRRGRRARLGFKAAARLAMVSAEQAPRGRESSSIAIQGRGEVCPEVSHVLDSDAQSQ